MVTVVLCAKKALRHIEAYFCVIDVQVLCMSAQIQVCG